MFSNKNPHRAGFALLALATIAIQPVSADQRFDEARHYIEQVVATQKAGTVSLSIAVAKDGEILWEEGFGWADVENRTRATEHTTYSLASISKPITATALMTLVEAGKIDLDRPANDYLGTGKLTGRRGDADAATVCRLANHTSGLPTHVNFYYADEPMVLPTVNESIDRYGKLVGVPGEAYVYSNLGFGILGYIGSRVSGSRYEDFMREAVFGPLGMSHSGVGVPPGLKPYAAVRYDKYGKVLPHYDFDHPGASAIYSSAHDLVRFGMMHIGSPVPGGKAVLSNATIEQMRHPACSRGGHEGYGLGWRVDQESGYEIVSHGGSMPGVKTILAMIPGENLVVVVLTNRIDDRSPTKGVPLRWQVANRAIKSLLSDWPLQFGKSTPAEQTPLALPDSMHGEWRGTVSTYESDIPLRLTIANNTIEARLGDQAATVVEDVSFKDGWLRGNWDGELDTDELNDRRPYGLRLNLHLDDARNLVGGVNAVSSGTKRYHYYVPHWTELKKR